jgi:hypothetical protein
MTPRTPVAGRSRSSPHAGLRPGCAAPFGAGGRGSASPLQHGRSTPVGDRDITVMRAPRLVGVRRCLTRPARRAGNACRWVSRCDDDDGGGGWQRTPGAEAPGSVRKPPEGGWSTYRRPGRSARWRRRLDQPASAGLGTEPGRSRPGGRGEGCSADLRCLSCETCRPRFIAAPVARAGEAAPRPYTVDKPSPVGHMGAKVGRSAPSCRGQAVPDPPAREGWQSPDGAMVAVPTGSWTRLTCATGMCRGRGAAGQLGRRAPTPVSWRVPGTEHPRGQPSVAGSARS